MPTRPLQTIITTANTVSRASAGAAVSPSVMVAISATSMMVTASVSSKVPKGSPIAWAITSAWWTAANTVPNRMTSSTAANTSPGADSAKP